MEVKVKGTGIKIPNAIMTAVLVLLTAGMFVLADDPRFALYGSIGLILVGWVAKAAEVNFSEVLLVLGKTHEDIPTEEELIDDLTEAIRPQAIGSIEGVNTSDVTVEPKSRLSEWFLG